MWNRKCKIFFRGKHQYALQGSTLLIFLTVCTPYQMCITLILTAADTDSHELQQQCMYNLFHIDIQVNPNKRNFNDACEWKCTQCIDGIVHGVVWAAPRQMLTRINIEWLPPTTEIAHFADTAIRPGINPKRLPRALRYLCLKKCRKFGEHWIPGIDLRSLPMRLEELHVIGGDFDGTVDLTCLPPTMQAISFIHVNCEALVVRRALLPIRLERVCVWSTCNAFTVESVDKPGKRIHCGPMRDTHWQTKRFSEFEEVAHVTK